MRFAEVSSTSFILDKCSFFLILPSSALALAPPSLASVIMFGKSVHSEREKRNIQVEIIQRLFATSWLTLFVIVVCCSLWFDFALFLSLSEVLFCALFLSGQMAITQFLRLDRILPAPLADTFMYKCVGVHFISKYQLQVWSLLPTHTQSHTLFLISCKRGWRALSKWNRFEENVYCYYYYLFTEHGRQQLCVINSARRFGIWCQNEFCSPSRLFHWIKNDVNPK